MTWPRAKLPATWCPAYGGDNAYVLSTCDGFEIAGLRGDDTAVLFIYDPGGMLVSVYDDGNADVRCLAGPSVDGLYAPGPCPYEIRDCPGEKVPRDAPSRSP